MKKILLIAPPVEIPDFYDYIKKEIIKRDIPELQDLFGVYNKQNFQPTGLLKIATRLKKEGHRVKLIDCRAETTQHNPLILRRKFICYRNCGNFENEKIKLRIDLCGMDYIKFKKILEKEETPDDIYVTSSLTYHNKPVHKIIQICKEVFPKTTVRLGGIYATLCSEDARKTQADFVHSGPLQNSKHEWLSLDILSYIPQYSIIKTSYGCPNNCTYCAVHKLEGHKMDYRRSEDVIKEIKYNLQKYGIKTFIFWESNILINYKQHLKKILDAIIKEKLDIILKFPEGFQPNLLTMEIAKKLYKAGLKYPNLPLESSTQSINKKLKRPSKLEDFERAINHLKRAGFKGKEISCFVLAGLPNQETDEIIKSIRYVWFLGCQPIVMPFSPVPMSEEFKKIFRNKENIKYECLDPFLFPFANKNMTFHDLMCLLVAGYQSPLEYVHLIQKNKNFLEKVFTKKELDYLLRQVNNQRSNLNYLN